MTAALHAEWTKLRTDPSTGWLLLGAVALTAALSAAAAAGACSSATCHQDPVKISLTGIEAGQAVVAILGVLAIGGEHSTGMIRTTLAATPQRWVVLVAKAAVVVGVVLCAGALAVLASMLAGRLLLPGAGFTAGHGYRTLSLTDGSTLRAAAGSVVYLALIAVLSLGVATVVRDPATAIGAVLGLLFLFPILTEVITDPDWQRHLRQIAPMDAGLAIQRTVDVRELPIAPWAGLGVLTAWAGAALLCGLVFLHRRDA